MLITTTIRGLDRELLAQARRSAVDDGETLGKWINQAIKAKLVAERDDLPILLDMVAERIGTEGVFRVPKGTVLIANDYVVDNHRISAAGRKGDEEVVTYETPSTIANKGYSIFWVR